MIAVIYNYADDTTFYYYGNSLECPLHRLKDEAMSTFEWFQNKDISIVEEPRQTQNTSDYNRIGTQDDLVHIGYSQNFTSNITRI